MRWFRFAGLILFVTVIQASVLANLDTGPDLLVILMVFFCIYCDPNDAMISAFVIGFAADLISSPMPLMPMGSQTLSFGLFGTGLVYVHRVINVRNFPSQALAIFSVALLAGALTLSLSLFKGHSVTTNAWRGLLGIALYSAIVGPFLFMPSAWWMNIRTNRFAR